MKKIITLLTLIIFLTGCSYRPKKIEQPEETYQPNPGAECQVNTDCKTPMEYMVQSNCPFGSACIENTCRVVCPISPPNSNPAIHQEYPAKCEVNSDCDCSERGEKTIECRCLEGACVSVEE